MLNLIMERKRRRRKTEGARGTLAVTEKRVWVASKRVHLILEVY